MNLALVRRYATSTEKLSPDRIRLFDEAEANTEALPSEDADGSVQVPAHTRKKRGCKPLPAALPRVGWFTNCPSPNGAAPTTAMH